MNRRNFYYRQKVTEAELDDTFDQVDEAVRQAAGANGLLGIHTGFAAAEDVPPSLALVLGAGHATDKAGRPLPGTGSQRVDFSVDENGASTAVAPAKGRWVSLLLAHDEVQSDPRVDGSGESVYWKRDDAVRYRVVMGPEEAAPPTTKPPLESEALVAFDFIMTNAKTAIVLGDLDYDRREDFLRSAGASWGDVRSFLQDLLGSGGGAAVGVTMTEDWKDGSGEITGAFTLDALLNQIVKQLATSAVGGSPPYAHAGEERIGAAAAAGTPDPLVEGSVASQLGALLGFVNARVRKAGGDTITGSLTYTGATAYPSRTVPSSGLELAWKSTAPGGILVRLYLTASRELWFTWNAGWDAGTSMWMADAIGSDAWAIHVSSSGVQVLGKPSARMVAGGWTMPISQSWTAGATGNWNAGWLFGSAAGNVMPSNERTEGPGEIVTVRRCQTVGLVDQTLWTSGNDVAAGEVWDVEATVVAVCTVSSAPNEAAATYRLRAAFYYDATDVPHVVQIGATQDLGADLESAGWAGSDPAFEVDGSKIRLKTAGSAVGETVNWKATIRCVVLSAEDVLG